MIRNRNFLRVAPAFLAAAGLLSGPVVMGFVTRGRGVTVHVKDCPKAFELDPARRIDVEWEPETDAPRRIRMRVRSQDVPGLLAKVTKTISAAGINIGAARVTTTADQDVVAGEQVRLDPGGAIILEDERLAVGFHQTSRRPAHGIAP